MFIKKEKKIMYNIHIKKFPKTNNYNSENKVIIV